MDETEGTTEMQEMETEGDIETQTDQRVKDWREESWRENAELRAESERQTEKDKHVFIAEMLRWELPGRGFQ